MASTTVAAGFTVGPFVCLAWGSGVQVMAFGDIAVETDQPTLPMLSGAGSRTWVEHSLPLNGDAVIEVGGAGDVDAATDLAGGVVLAGGFRLELVGAADRAAGRHRAVAGARAGRRARGGRRARHGGGARARRRRRRSSRRRRPPTARRRPSTADDPAAALAAIQAAAVGADGEPLHQTGAVAAAPRRAGPPRRRRRRRTTPTSRCRRRSRRLLARRVRPRAGRRPGLARRRQACAATATQPADGGDVRGVRRVPGARVVVDRPRPAAEPRAPAARRRRAWSSSTTSCSSAATPTATPTRRARACAACSCSGDKVSRSHLEVRFQGWEVLVADCGSTNGTFVVPHPGGQVVALEPGRPQMVEPGATVYFGSRSFTVRRAHERRVTGTSGCASTSSARSPTSSPATS